MNKACMYLRLSREDGDSMESNSISNQRQIILTYALANDLEVVHEYIDDGYSGSNFDRPDFIRMTKDLDKGLVKTVIVKDLSRFGRDYIESGKYLQKIFPEKGIRFISVNDSYDSEKADTSDTHLILPIRNFINDSYCRDISMKVKSAKEIKRKNGEFIGSFAPFGYKKSLHDRHQLIIDEEVADIIRRIFYMKVEGYSSKAIADFLNHIGTVTPSRHKERQGEKLGTGFFVKEARWDAKMINRILENKVYIGVLEQGKTCKLNYKSKKEIAVQEEDWIVTDQAHEAIVSKTTFSLANKMLLRDLRVSKEKPGLFAGMLYCADCGSAMVRRVVRTKNSKTVYYICSKHNRSGACSRHSIRESLVKEQTLESLQGFLRDYRTILSKLSQLDISDINVNADFDSLEKEKEKYERLRKSLYMDLEDSLITTEEFDRYRNNYRLKIRKIEGQIEAKKAVVKELEKRLKDKSKLFSNLPNEEVKELSRGLLVTFIDKIEVKEDGSLHFIYNHIETVRLLQKLTEKKEEKKVTGSKTISIHSIFSKPEQTLTNSVLGGVCHG